ncbi:MAG: TrbC/VirB2 family protein [Alphaproteobacteria bacterium]|nr:TrbC/VirB2 family protein [Alphaproteobacteria bacterium]
MKQRRTLLPMRLSSLLPLFLAALCLSLFFPEAALAADDPIGDVICTVVSWFTGPVGKAVASLAIIVLGIMALFGKLSPGVAITTIVGITIMFNGADVVNALNLGIAADCSGNTVLVMGCEIQQVLCAVSGWFSSDLGKGIGTISVLMLGFGAAFGKLSPAQTILVIIGIVMMFGSAQVLQAWGLGVGDIACALCR